jgi:hypothetical protein
MSNKCPVETYRFFLENLRNQEPAGDFKVYALNTYSTGDEETDCRVRMAEGTVGVKSTFTDPNLLTAILLMLQDIYDNKPNFMLGFCDYTFAGVEDDDERRRELLDGVWNNLYENVCKEMKCDPCSMEKTITPSKFLERRSHYYTISDLIHECEIMMEEK